MSETWTIKKLLDWSETYFESHRIDEGRLSAQWLLGHVLGLNRMDLFLQFDRELAEAELQAYKSLIVRRIKHEPLQYIMGEADFMGKRFIVSPAVLIPRWDTEVLAEQAILYLKDNAVDAVIDIGTGSGILAITIAMEYPQFPVIALDISDAALEIAKQNAARHSVSIDFENGSWPPSIAGQGTVLVVSNPPYIVEAIVPTLPDEVKYYEPHLALSGGADGLDVIRLILQKMIHSRREVQLFLEIGYDQGPSVSGLLAQAGFYDISTIPDYEGRDRVVRATYTPA